MDDSESINLLPTIEASSTENTTQNNPPPTFQDFKNCYFISPDISRGDACQFLRQIEFTYHMTHPVTSSNLHLWIEIFRTSIQEIGNLYVCQEWLNLMVDGGGARTISPGDFYYNNLKNYHLIWIMVQNKIEELLKEQGFDLNDVHKLRNTQLEGGEKVLMFLANMPGIEVHLTMMQQYTEVIKSKLKTKKN